MATHTEFHSSIFEIMYFQLHRPAYQQKSPSHMLATSPFLWMIHSGDLYTFENVLDLGSSCHWVNTSISTFSAEWRKHTSQMGQVKATYVYLRLPPPKKRHKASIVDLVQYDPTGLMMFWKMQKDIMSKTYQLGKKLLISSTSFFRRWFVSFLLVLWESCTKFWPHAPICSHSPNFS